MISIKACVQLVAYQCVALVKSLFLVRRNENILVTNWYWVLFMSQWSGQCWESGSSSTLPSQQGVNKSQGGSLQWTLVIGINKNMARPLCFFSSNQSFQQEEDQKAQERWRDWAFQHWLSRKAFRETSEMHNFLFSFFLNLILPPIIYMPLNLIKSKLYVLCECQKTKICIGLWGNWKCT